MALYDQRTFRHGDDWWVAEVHSAAGAGVGPGLPAATLESAIFTNLSKPDEPSRSARIPAGYLNYLSHEAILGLLKTAGRWEARFEMSPRNAPDADELAGWPQVLDHNGLLWVFREKDMPEWNGQGISNRPSLELVCLDDSALHGDIVFNSPEVRTDFLALQGNAGVQALILHVLDRFRSLDPDWMD